VWGEWCIWPFGVISTKNRTQSSFFYYNLCSALCSNTEATDIWEFFLYARNIEKEALLLKQFLNFKKDEN